MDILIGFIGGGNMAQAILAGILTKGIYKAEEIIVSDRNEATLAKVKARFGVKVTQDNKVVAQEAKLIVLAIVPQVFTEVGRDITHYLTPQSVLVSIAAGKSLASLGNIFGNQGKICRSMPNTPAFVGLSMTALCPNAHVKEGEIKQVKRVFDCVGTTEIVPEELMDTVVGISGSSPAYFYMIIEAMADGAVLHGMSREQAYRFAAHAMLGSAKMVLDQGQHPGALKDAVCSPGGTTIAAVCAMEKEGLRNAIIKGVSACIQRAKEMGNGD